LPTEELIPLAERLLEVPQELICTALDLELQEGTVIANRVGETPCIFLAAPDAVSVAPCRQIPRELGRRQVGNHRGASDRA
jgi:hypothetical protein